MSQENENVDVKKYYGRYLEKFRVKTQDFAP